MYLVDPSGERDFKPETRVALFKAGEFINAVINFLTK